MEASAARPPERSVMRLPSDDQARPGRAVSWAGRVYRHPLAQSASVVLVLGVASANIHFKSLRTAQPRAPEASSPGPARVEHSAPEEIQPGGGPAASAEPAAEEEPGATVVASAESIGATAPALASPAPEPDRAAIAEAEGELDAASRDRARSESRAEDAARRLALATGQAALEAARARKLAFLVRDPSTRIAQASNRGGFLRGERDKLAQQVTALRQVPRPKQSSILGKSPVARPATSDEFHFELCHNRVGFINLDRLMELTKADAQVRIRMSDRVPVISSQVVPVGSYSLAYELVRATPSSVEELIERRGIRFELRAWEVVPESETRGETYELTRNPISEYAQAINRMNPGRATVTLWVYPDSFALYRRLREELVERGFSVAGRPLPQGTTIRGSPLGTQSAAQ